MYMLYCYNQAVLFYETNLFVLVGVVVVKTPEGC